MKASIFTEYGPPEVLHLEVREKLRHLSQEPVEALPAERLLHRAFLHDVHGDQPHLAGLGEQSLHLPD